MLIFLRLGTLCTHPVYVWGGRVGAIYVIVRTGSGTFPFAVQWLGTTTGGSTCCRPATAEPWRNPEWFWSWPDPHRAVGWYKSPTHSLVQTVGSQLAEGTELEVLCLIRFCYDTLLLSSGTLRVPHHKHSDHYVSGGFWIKHNLRISTPKFELCLSLLRIILDHYRRMNDISSVQLLVNLPSFGIF